MRKIEEYVMKKIDKLEHKWKLEKLLSEMNEHQGIITVKLKINELLFVLVIRSGAILLGTRFITK
jgi:hypothetical protein